MPILWVGFDFLEFRAKFAVSVPLKWAREGPLDVAANHIHSTSVSPRPSAGLREDERHSFQCPSGTPVTGATQPVVLTDGPLHSSI